MATEVALAEANAASLGVIMATFNAKVMKLIMKEIPPSEIARRLHISRSDVFREFFTYILETSPGIPENLPITENELDI